MSDTHAIGVNAQYNVARPDSLPVRIAGYQRRKMFERFVKAMGPGEADSIVDVGATSDRSYDHSNYLEAWHPHKDRVTAVGVDDASFLDRKYTVWGKVVSGMENVDKIKRGEPVKDPDKIVKARMAADAE